MRTVTAFEAKTRFGELLERVSRGEEIIITRHEKPVARLIPEGSRRVETIRRAVDELRRIREGILTRTHGRARLSAEEVRSAIDEGRPRFNHLWSMLQWRSRGSSSAGKREQRGVA